MRLKVDKLVENGITNRRDDTEEIQVSKLVHVFAAIAVNSYRAGQCVYGRIAGAFAAETGDKWDDDGDKWV